MKKQVRRMFSIVMALLIAMSLPIYALAAEYDLAAGSVVVNAPVGADQTVTHGGVDMGVDLAPVITQSNAETATGNTVTITGGGEANVTLDGVNIAASGSGITVQGTTDANITISGDNTVTGGFLGAGVNVGTDASLTIEGTESDSLTATGGYFSAGIGSTMENDAGDITINGGNIEAAGGKLSAGIGAATNSSAGNITINGGNITATGDNGSAGIGGSGHYGGDIVINGGTVDATGGVRGGAGIGGGLGGNGGSVTINGGDVTSQGGDGSTISIDAGGAGIGSGNDCSAPVNVTINAGTVNATGGVGAAGIGGGCIGEAGNVVIEGGNITATGGENFSETVGSGSGIGGGANATGGSVIINGGEITAVAGATGDDYTGPATEDLSGDVTHNGGNINDPSAGGGAAPVIPEIAPVYYAAPAAPVISLVNGSSEMKINVIVNGSSVEIVDIDAAQLAGILAENNGVVAIVLDGIPVNARSIIIPISILEQINGNLMLSFPDGTATIEAVVLRSAIEKASGSSLCFTLNAEGNVEIS